MINRITHSQNSEIPYLARSDGEINGVIKRFTEQDKLITVTYMERGTNETKIFSGELIRSIVFKLNSFCNWIVLIMNDSTVRFIDGNEDDLKSAKDADGLILGITRFNQSKQ